MDSIKELQKCQLNILRDVKRVCEKYGIQFFLAYGTCIGAYRHRGFIPWDDDIDICMDWNDLELLKKHASELKSYYFLQCSETDPEYGLMITRIRDSRTTLIEKEEADRDINHGIFIDIYPLFPTYQNGFRASSKVLASYLYRLLLYGKAPYHHGKFVSVIAGTFLKIIPNSISNKLKERCLSVMRKETHNGYLSILYGGHERIAYNKEWLFPTIQMEFEGEEMPVPKEVEKVLSLGYGDFMKLPPEDQRKVHHDYILMDPNNSFRIYKGTQYCKEKQK